MLQTLERTSHDAAAIAEPLKVIDQAARPDIEQEDGLLAGAGPIMMASYAIAFAIAVLTFKGSGEALLAVAISISFAIVFFTVPMLLMQVRARHDPRWRPQEPVDGTVDIWTGRVGRAEAVVHMVIVPLAVAFAFMAFALIWVLVRP